MSLIGSISRRARSWNQARKSLLRVGVAGDDLFAQSIAMAYASNLDCIPAAIWHPDPDLAKERADAWGFGKGTDDFDRFLGLVDAVELVDSGERARELAKAALKAGRHLSMRRPFARSLAEADALLSMARSDRVFRVLDDAVFYPPHRRLAALLEDEEIGEVSNVRFFSNLAGSGGRNLPLSDLEGDYLFCDPFDKFGLAISLLGRINRIQGVLHPMDAQRGGQAVVLARFAREALYACFELVYSPSEAIRSESYPANEQIEVGGTGGYIWVNRFSSPTFEPAIAVRLPDRYYQIGVESSLDYDRSGAHRNASIDMTDACLRKKPSLYPAVRARHALAVLLGAMEAGKTGKLVDIA